MGEKESLVIRFSRGQRLLLVLCALLAILVCLFLLLPNRLESSDLDSSGNSNGSRFLSNRNIDHIQEIHIKNQYDDYSLFNFDGDITLGDLPMEAVNDEYLSMLLDESARVEYETLVSKREKNLKQYGLDDPRSAVSIIYTDGAALSFSIGNEETVSRGWYLLKDGDVYLIRNSRAVRFIMPLSRYIKYEIVPPRGFQSPLRSIKTLRLSGSAFDEAIVIEEVDADDPDAMRDAASFGVATHLIRKPVLHEIDQKECIAVFGSLTGLLNKDVFTYNCTEEELAAYGFTAPLVQAEYDYQINSETPVQHIVLKVVRYKGEYLLMRDTEPVVHRIENKAFIETRYEKLAMRWFLTPFVTDLSAMDCEIGQKFYTFVFSGASNKDLSVTVNGNPLTIDLFRKFYSLLINASNDGSLLKQPVPKSDLLVQVRFDYKDPQKPPDTLRLFDGGSRRLNVEVNGITEFAMLRRYLMVLQNAADALLEEQDFTVDW